MKQTLEVWNGQITLRLSKFQENLQVEFPEVFLAPTVTMVYAQIPKTGFASIATKRDDRWIIDYVPDLELQLPVDQREKYSAANKKMYDFLVLNGLTVLLPNFN